MIKNQTKKKKILFVIPKTKRLGRKLQKGGTKMTEQLKKLAGSDIDKYNSIIVLKSSIDPSIINAIEALPSNTLGTIIYDKKNYNVISAEVNESMLGNSTKYVQIKNTDGTSLSKELENTDSLLNYLNKGSKSQQKNLMKNALKTLKKKNPN